MLTINTNLMAMNAARNLNFGYAQLSTSVQRLSSGLRINSGADDAAGLAIRELMRAEIASLRQGVRNANDAISLIQTADGALAVIDEKLIRMKELAMQASTGTYNSDQRLIIDSEYQAMASEITRIANATKFNGIHLLNGNLSARPEHTAVANWHLSHNGDGMKSTGPLKVHFGPSNNSAEDYYYIQIATATASALGLGGTPTESYNLSWAEILAANPGLLPSHLRDSWSAGDYYWDNTPDPPRSEFPDQSYDVFSGGGGLFYAVLTDGSGVQRALRYDGSDVPLIYLGEGGITVRGTRTASAGGTAGSGASSISTQQLAQEALKTLETAILSKDNIRADLGALQNRLQNTITNLQIQAENLQAAESRISDADVALEMTRFVRNQILTQAAVAMLAQANSLPRMAMQLIGG